MAWSLAQVVARDNARPSSSVGLCALVLGGLAAYSVDRLGDAATRARGPAWLSRALAVGTLVAALGGLALIPILPYSKVELLALCGAIALAYPWVKRIPLGKTVLVPAVWTWATLALPTVDPSAFAWRAALVPLAAPLFLLLAAGCLLCDVKDADADRDGGVPSLPARLGLSSSLAIAAAAALLGSALALAQHRTGLVAGGLCLLALSARPRLLATESVGPLLVDAALTVPGLLVVLRWT
jgi:4-hydroxybenzoate polyprenyltransferase